MTQSSDALAERVSLIAEGSRLAAEIRDLAADLADRTHELAQSEERFRAIIERNADAVVVVDPSGIVRFANRTASVLFGKRHAELVGASFGFPMVTGDTTEVDLFVQGTPRVAEMRAVDSEWEGQRACIATLRDITDRKRAEQDARRLFEEQAARNAAERAAARLRFLLDSTTVLTSTLDYETTLQRLARLCVPQVADWVVVYGVDEEGKVRRAKVAHKDPAMSALAEELCCIPIDDESASPILDVLRSRRAVLHRSVAQDALPSLTQDTRQVEIIRELGVASFMLVPMVARDRSVGAIALISASPEREFADEDLALAEDTVARAALVVDNARLYHEARIANRTKSDFLAVVSHDLRTPLNAIVGYAELLVDGIPDRLTDASRQHVERIRRAGKHLIYLINELLAFARLDAGREELRMRDVDVCDIARDVSEVIEPMAAERGLRYTLTLPREPVRLRTDPDKLRQVLLNLVSNAVNYTRHGAVTLALHADATDDVVISVIDTGAGIDEAHRERIFDPFWQVDSSQRAKGGGTGLGLSIVRRLVQLLGGSVTVESAVGEGSTFTVRLSTIRSST